MLVLGGSDSAARLHLETNFSNLDSAVSANTIEHRARIDAGATASLADGSISATISMARAALMPFGNYFIDESFDSTLERSGAVPVADVVVLDRNSLLQTTFSITDRARLHSSVTAYRQRPTGMDSGSVAGIGVALAWQLSPSLSLRSGFCTRPTRPRPCYASLVLHHRAFPQRLALPG